MKNLVRIGLLALLSSLASSCGDVTGSQRVTFAARAAGFEHNTSEPVVFTNDLGWTITLHSARMAVGPVYLNTVEALSALSAQRRSPLSRSLSELLIRSAYANGTDHLGAGQFVGEVTRQCDIDVLSPSAVELPGGGAGVNDRARTAEVWLYNREGPMQGSVVRVSGAATRAEVTVEFTGSLVADESIATSNLPLEAARRVRGIPVDITVAQGGTLTLRVDPRGWFNGADFAELAQSPDNPSGAHIFSTRDNVGRAFVANVRLARGVYRISFEGPRH